MCSGGIFGGESTDATPQARTVEQGPSIIFRADLRVNERVHVGEFLLRLGPCSVDREMSPAIVFSVRFKGTRTEKNLPYDPIKDFAPITLVSMDPNVIVGSLDLPADSAQSLLDYLKAHPRTPIGTIGPATSGRFATELMKAKLGIEMTPVPYKSTGPLLTDMAGGQIPLGIMGESTAVPFLKDKRIKAFVLTSLKPSRILPDLPTLDGIASKGFDAVAWSALYAPPKTPEAIIAKINAAMKEAAQAPEVKKWLDESGLQVPLGTPQELTDFMQADIDKWVKVAKDNHLTFNSGR